MKWDQSLSIGCELVDSQHKELIHLVDNLESALGKGLQPQQIGAALKFIVNYTRHHFKTEEEFMDSIGFDGLESHKKLHNDLIKSVTDILKDLKAGKDLDQQDLVNFLVAWVKDHVIEEDMKIGEFARQQKSLIDKQNECLRLTVKRREDAVGRLDKLKNLFRQKLIAIEDFKEQKIRIFANMLADLGYNRFREGVEDLNCFLAKDVICHNEHKAIVIAFLEKSTLEQSLKEASDLEGKLLLLRSFHEFELISDDKFDQAKTAILESI